VLSWFAQEDTDRYMPLIEALPGRVEGRDIAFEYRWADGDAARAAQFAAELVRGRVDVLVALASPAAEAARRATQTIPIVFAVADPLDIGLVDNLARPGGNLTGVSMIATDVAAKWLEFLREIIPGLARVAFLGSTGTPTTPDILRQIEATAARSNIVVQPMLSRQRPRDRSSVRCGRGGADRRGHCAADLGVEPYRDRRSGAAPSAAVDRRQPGIRRSRRTDLVWREPRRAAAPRRQPSRSHPARCRPWRPADRAADDVPAGRQS
jgi:putative ABC transport system substrate-binding protein